MGTVFAEWPCLSVQLRAFDNIYILYCRGLISFSFKSNNKVPHSKTSAQAHMRKGLKTCQCAQMLQKRNPRAHRSMASLISSHLSPFPFTDIYLLDLSTMTTQNTTMEPRTLRAVYSSRWWLSRKDKGQWHPCCFSTCTVTDSHLPPLHVLIANGGAWVAYTHRTALECHHHCDTTASYQSGKQTREKDKVSPWTL